MHTASQPDTNMVVEEKGREKKTTTIKQPENNKMALVSPYLSIITLNVNG